ncbi:hypothetical protein B0O99DRAFT_514284 [Bisporella sp. PMI_857]|nr:hypothetical protein B0O99DRAFT_514284 [Bisporella sp. PMI_857]
MALPPPPDGDRNRAAQLLAVYWVQSGISIIVVALRFYVRYAKRIIGVEDWAMLACLLLYVTGSALLPVLTHYGIGRHIYYVPPENISHVLRWNWIIQPFGIAAQPFGKISVSFFLVKLLGPKDVWRKWFLYANMILFSIMASLCIIFTYAQCNPPRALWENVPDAKCWDPKAQANFSIATTAFGALVDYELSLFPITILWNLKMPTQRKISLYVLLSFSVFSGISATVKAVQLQELANRVDQTWDTFALYCWASSELFVNIVCGSIPTLKPLYDKWVSGRALLPSNKEPGYKYSGSSSYKLKDSPNSSQNSSPRFTEKSTMSSTTDGYHYQQNPNVGKAITVEHSFDVESRNNSVSSQRSMV